MHVPHHGVCVQQSATTSHIFKKYIHATWPPKSSSANVLLAYSTYGRAIAVCTSTCLQLDNIWLVGALAGSQRVSSSWGTCCSAGTDDRCYSYKAQLLNMKSCQYKTNQQNGNLVNRITSCVNLVDATTILPDLPSFD